ncbi:NfeD family protein [Niveibacterium terrae]|uniref:NfeD family protein n=1 Tax=Niveibacterium terrae TaxID=3373598 RepID=UPI003A9531BB
MDSTSFIWAVAAIVVLGIEMMLGTVYLLAWSAGLAVGALLQWLSGSLPAAASLAALTVLAGSLLAHRVRVTRRPVMADPDIGGEARLLTPLANARWRVEFRGTQWDARIVRGAEFAAPGASARVCGREANCLLLELSQGES